MAETATLVDEAQTDEVLNSGKDQFVNRKNLTSQEEILLTGRLGEPRSLEGCGKRVQIVDVEGGERAILKRQKYSDIQCEAAAFVVSDVLVFDLVPATVIREVNGEQVSLQEFVPDATLSSDMDERQFEDNFYKLWVFDHIIRSNDRDYFNVLFQGVRMVAIDHEAAFYSLPKESDYDTFKTFYGVGAPEGVKRIFRDYFADSSFERRLREDLSGLLDRKELDETIARVNQLGRVILEKGYITNPESMTPREGK